MLQFIVLGQVPGTDISLSFTQVLLILAGFYGAILLVRDFHRHQPAKPARLEDIAL